MNMKLNSSWSGSAYKLKSTKSNYIIHGSIKLSDELIVVFDWRPAIRSKNSSSFGNFHFGWSNQIVLNQYFHCGIDKTLIA